MKFFQPSSWTEARASAHRRRWLGRPVAIAVLFAGIISSARLAGQTPINEEEPWPRTRSTNGHRVVIHLPQIEQWTSNSLTARAAVEVKLANSRKESLGVIWFAARGSVNHSNQLVTLDTLEVSKARFPDSPDEESNIRSLLNGLLPSGARTVSLDYLVTTLGLGRAAARQGKAGLRHEPPLIIWATNRVALVIIDGEPVLRPISGSSLQRIINTPALIVFDPDIRRFFLQGNGQWFESDEMKGPWRVSRQFPPAVAALTDTPSSATGEGKSEGATALNTGVAEVFVSTRPAELLSTAGLPDFRKIAGTALRYAADSDNQLFFYDSDREAYLLLSGRWFKSASLKGPWTYVRPSQLPADFAKIPLNHPKALVLASVPNTPQAELASVATTVPTMATVSRHSPAPTLQYDGEPRFKPIEGTKLLYAVNANLPVIRAGEGFYSLDRGVWFVASAASGPWSVAAEVPEEIYSIPPSSPVYYATFARVLEADGQAVEVSYTPGYQGAYENEGTVVYGTGWDYEPWLGEDYYGWGWTWGYTYVYNPWLQWWLWRNWWNQPGGLWSAVVDNVYERWEGRTQVKPHNPPGAAARRTELSGQFSGYPAFYGRFGRGKSAAFAPPQTTLLLNPYTRFEAPARPGTIPRGAELLRQTPKGGRDLYASPDGNIYQRRDNGWYRRQPGGNWSFAAPAAGRVERVDVGGQSQARLAGGGGGAARVNALRTAGHADRVPQLGSELSAEGARAMEREYYARALYQMRQQAWNGSVNRPRAGRFGGRRR